ncbi:hypothetical protein KOW79_009675 [Hemibagrus wyckioides]|uniref:CENP-R n=1 Tax=Hemibagrus wyckioides TaxID=337641 RepID=A0A9D3NPT5_9TELE|nr:uncharacterized protein itgb3bp isoform X1 [Hemibagrus wyckioides]KAG7326274.1 hypothetical protein KOW79_009675 [Hemibagrus wyckioides]
MPVKRRIQVEEKENTPVKRHTRDKNYSPLTGTKPMTPTGKTQAGNYKTSGTTVNALEAQETQTETERLDFLRSKLEGSLEALMKTRQDLESLLPVEGNSELRSFLLMGPADLHNELKRHKELSSKVNCEVNATRVHEKWLQGTTQTGSSYEFLKNILSG